MFDQSDPRSKLMVESAVGGKSLANDIAPVKHMKFYEENPSTLDSGAKSWWCRGQNFYMHYAEATSGKVFSRTNQVDEYVIILPDISTQAIIKWEEQELKVEGYSLIIVPKGNSEIELVYEGRMARLFSINNHDLADLPMNKKDYETPDLNILPFQPWPESTEGSRIRVYSLDVPKEEGRFGRIFRCSTFMISFLYPWEGPRDAKKLSPHSHDDFEQCTFSFRGEFVHHFRWPWGVNKEKWRPDLHDYYASPSVTFIPPGVIHTTEAVGPEVNELVDIFCPPRMDFSKQDGWVLNEEDYPLE